MTALSTTILIADDEPVVAAMIERIISSMGLSAVTVPDGAQAVQVAQAMQQQLACAILDVAMPGTTGIDAAEAIRQFLPNLPIILMSGAIPSTLTQRVNQLPHSAVLLKPFRIQVVKSLVTQMLQKGLAP